MASDREFSDCISQKLFIRKNKAIPSVMKVWNNNANLSCVSLTVILVKMLCRSFTSVILLYASVIKYCYEKEACNKQKGDTAVMYRSVRTWCCFESYGYCNGCFFKISQRIGYRTVALGFKAVDIFRTPFLLNNSG